MVLKTNTGNERMAEFLRAGRERISREWVAAVTKSSKGRISTAETERELLPMLDALIEAARLGADESSNPCFDELRAMLGEYSRTRARNGFSPSETAVAVFALRDTVLSAVGEAGETIPYADFAAFSHLIDDLGLVTFETFAETRERIIANQTEQLLELSTPVVKLWEGVVAVPLVGTLDSARTQVVMESLLTALVSTGSAHAIIDITGVPAVDTQVAQHLLKTVVAARLMGAEVIISGIRPQIAQTIVALGIEFGDIATKASLADALRTTLSRSGFEIRKGDRKA
ncbi:MAG TPA: STAS domain-containing protein [Candidatus Baltobacteraceae bacterium]|nr:STAS domain-containing protein [Candidatus Baltobacteraceae bacterium]